MGKRARVVWSEGLLLTPQHLQHQDRYFEETSAELFRASRPFNHGFISLTLDEEAIQNGQVVVQDAAGVTRNGIPFSFPDRDGVPAGRSIEQHFPVGMNSLPVYVGIRIHRPGEREISDGENGDLRYRRGQLNAYDQTTGENERPENAFRAPRTELRNETAIKYRSQTVTCSAANSVAEDVTDADFETRADFAYGAGG